MAALICDIPFSAVALTASTAKTVVAVKAPANQVLRVLEACVSFDGSTSTNTPALVELCTWTGAGAGTPGSIPTPVKRDTGRTETVQSTAGVGYTAEPTVLAAEQSKYLGQFNGFFHYILPFAAPIIVPGGKGYAVRVTSPNTVNAAGHITFEE
jgi:hypothetical protein